MFKKKINFDKIPKLRFDWNKAKIGNGMGVRFLSFKDGGNKFLKEMKRWNEGNSSQDAVKDYLLKAIKQRKLNGSIVAKIFEKQNPNLNQPSLPLQVKVEKGLVEPGKSVEVNIPPRYSLFDLLFSFALFGSLLYYSLSSSPVSSILESPPSKFEKKEKEVRFKDVIGNDEAKQELSQICHFLKEKHIYESYGAQLPKGVLLYGPPGTGKTLLARALAYEAGVPFYYISASSLDNVLVGSGSGKLKRLVNEIEGPAIIFIDEIETLGSRKDHPNYSKFRYQTLNQLLTIMDGFKPNSGIIFFGATNFLQGVDPALRRSGRFDRAIFVAPPTQKVRVELWKYFTSKLSGISNSINFDNLAKISHGLTGADIETIVNNAAVKVVFGGKGEVEEGDLRESLEDLELGPSRLNKQKWDLTAFHEAGHAIAAIYGDNKEELRYVTIVPRGGALGYVASSPSSGEGEEPSDSFQKTKSQLLSIITVSLAGRAAEELYFGNENVTAGASSDFKKATRIAELMVKTLGMDEEQGLEVIEERDIENDEVSEKVAQIIERRVDKIVSDCYQKSKDLLKKYSKEHKRLSNALLQYETLNGEEIKEILKGNSIRGDSYKPDQPPNIQVLEKNKINKYTPKVSKKKDFL